MAGSVLQRERDEDEADAQQAQLVPGDRVLLVEPLERGRVVESKPRLGEALADLGAEGLCRPALGGRKLAPQQVGHAAVQVAKPAIDCQLQPALGLGSLCCGHAVGARDDDEVGVAEVVGNAAHHLQLADEFVRGDERLARDMAAALGHHLVLEVSGRDARVEVQLDRALDVEEVPVSRVHVDHHGRDLEVGGRDLLVGVAHRHGQLELAERAHASARAVRDLDRRVEVHVRGAQVADREGVAAEVDGVEAVIHDELGAHGVVHPGGEDVGLGSQHPAQPPARRFVARRGNLEAGRKQWSRDEIHLGPPTRFRDRSCRVPGIRTRARSPVPAIGFPDP